jgi:hypothetical protein
MKQKKRTEIIFERREITRIRIARRPAETVFEPADTEIAADPPEIEKPVGLKRRWQAKLRRFWKPNRRS